MKRIKNKHKTEKLRREALDELRKTRARLEKEHPVLFEAVQQLVANMEKVGPPGAGGAEDRSVGSPDSDNMVKVDRQKNLETILKYAALSPASKDVQKYLKAFLH